MPVIHSMLRRLRWLLCVAALTVSGLEIRTAATAAELDRRWAGMPAGRTPDVPMLDAVAVRQPFRLWLFFRDPAVRGGRIDLAARVTIRRPDGSVWFDRALGELRAPYDADRPAGLFPHALPLAFSAADPVGEYRIETECADRISGETVRAETSLRLREKAAEPESEPEPNRFLSNYYRAPRPEAIPAAYRAARRELRAEDGVTPGAFAAFYWLLRENPQWWPEFAALAEADAARGDRRAAEVLGAIDGAATLLPERLRPVAPVNFEVKQVEEPADLDRLWAEFFITGRPEPFRRVVLTLAYLQSPPAGGAAAERRRRCGEAARWSLREMVRTHRLAADYLEALVAGKELPADSRGEAVKILGAASTPQSGSVPEDNNGRQGR